jgi:hypothetical protein
MRTVTTTVLCVLMIGGTAPRAWTADTPTSIGTVTHRGLTHDVTLPMSAPLRDKDKFSIQVENTCEGQFDYTVYGIERAISGQPERAPVGPAPVAQLSTKSVQGTYDSKYGIYVLKIASAADPKPCYEFVDKDGKAVSTDKIPKAALTDPNYSGPEGNWKVVGDLKALSVFVPVAEAAFEVAQDAALTIMVRADDKYYADANKVVQYNGNQSDPVRFQFATLTHFYLPGRSHGPAVGFGATNNVIDVYGGYSFGLGPRDHRLLNLAIGVVLTKVPALPAGIAVGTSTISDPTTLEKLATHYAPRLFVGVTATFFKSGDRSPGDKPVAPTPPPQ